MPVRLETQPLRPGEPRLRIGRAILQDDGDVEMDGMPETSLIEVVMNEGSFEGLVPPLDMVVLRFSGESGEISLHDAPELGLTERARQAVAAAPAWLRSALAFRLSRLEADTQDRVAETILDPGDPRYVDEIAFVVASLSPADADAFRVDEDLLVENARLIYELDEILDYVSIVDHGDPEADDDFFSTVRYALAGGEEIELPRDLYYWWIVHPRAVGEYLAYLDPSTDRFEAPGDGGVHWRSYFAYQDEDPTRTAWLHFLTEHLHVSDSETLSGWDPSAQGHLTDFLVDPTVLASDQATGEPVLVLYHFPDGVLEGSRRTFDATVIATTMPLERAYENGRGDLLENLVPAGTASSRIHGGGYRVLVVKDRDPWGTPTVENVLTDVSLAFDVIRSADLASTDLGAYVKIIVPSAQPRALYEALEAATDQLDGWLGPPRSNPEVGHERVLQIHGAIDQAQPDDAWCDLTLPGGFSCDSLEGAVDDVELGGYPRFLETVTPAEVLWDRESYYALGHEPLEADAHALRRIAYFGAQNMLDRCGEIPRYYAGPDYECPRCDGRALSQDLRSPYPQRMLYVHFGNCGETRITLVAAGRTGLVPTAPVAASSQDHVWNELNLGDGWLHYEFVRSDQWMHVGPQRDESYGGHWNSVERLRGDGYVENATPPYDEETFTLVVTVTDRDGVPVDGARVMTATEYRSTDDLVITMQAWTDQDGHVEIELGPRMNVYLNVTSPLGSIPAENTVALVACPDGFDARVGPCHDSNVVSAVYDVDIRYEDAAVTDPAVTENDTLEGSEVLALRVSVGRAVLFGTNAIVLRPDELLEFLEPKDQGVMDISVVDEENLALARTGAPFTALRHFRDVTDLEVDLPVERGGDDLFLILSNYRGQGHALEVNAQVFHRVDVPDEPDAGPDAGPDGGSDRKDSGGCGCRAGGPGPAKLPAAALALLGLLAVLRRRPITASP